MSTEDTTSSTSESIAETLPLLPGDITVTHVITNPYADLPSRKATRAEVRAKQRAENKKKWRKK
jgi:hypothetical protein